MLRQSVGSQGAPQTRTTWTDMTVRSPLIGVPVERVEDLRLLRGRGSFVADVASGDAVQAAIFRSSVAHGRIRRLDVSRARRQAGVLAVITAADIGQPVSRLPL